MVIGNSDSGDDEVERRARRDIGYAAGAAGVFAACVVVSVQGEPSSWEIGLFRFVNRLPATVSAPLTGVMQLGALAAVGAFAFGAAVVRRPRLARALLSTGVVSWLLAKAFVALIDRRQPDDVLDQVVVRGRVLAAASFPSTHCAVAGALAVVAAPYLGRFGRRVCVLAVTAVAVSRLYVGAQFPIDALGGLALGATVAAAFTSVVGAPPVALSTLRVERLLARRGIAVDSLRPRRTGADQTFVEADDTKPERHLVVLTSRHERGRGWLSHSWRYLAFRDTAGLGPLRSPRERNEHTALMSVLAQRAGVATPQLCHTGDIGAEHSISVYKLPAGRPLTELATADIDHHLLAAVWTEVHRLHDAGIVLEHAVPDDIMIATDGRAWLNNLGAAILTTDPDAQHRDIAEVFVALALVAHPTDVATAAATVLGPGPLAQAAVHLHPAALSHGISRRLRDRDDLLARSRAAIAIRTGTDEPAVIPPARVAARNLAFLAAGAVAINLLLGQVGQAKQTIAALRAPNWFWIAALFASMTITYLAAAIALIGATTTRLTLPRTFAVQFAAAFGNRLAPAGLGGMATNVRYLERAGSDRPASLAAVTVNTLAGFIVHTIALVAIVPSLGPLATVDIDPPHYWPVLIGAVAASTASGVVAWIRFMPPHLIAKVRAAFGSLTAVFRSPTRTLALFGGSAALTATYGFALFAALHAFGAHIPLARVIAVYLGASAIATLSPTPGGLGALEAALVAGLTHTGTPASTAVVAVLSYRLITYWFPVLPGILAFRSLRRHGHL